MLKKPDFVATVEQSIVEDYQRWRYDWSSLHGDTLRHHSGIEIRVKTGQVLRPKVKMDKKQRHRLIPNFAGKRRPLICKQQDMKPTAGNHCYVQRPGWQALSQRFLVVGRIARGADGCRPINSMGSRSVIARDPAGGVTAPPSASFPDFGSRNWGPPANYFERSLDAE